MIGTSDERLSLSKEINRAYEKSLEADEKKKAEKERQKQIEKHLLELMEERKARVVAEPSLVEPHVTITVRHCNLESKVRQFREDLSFAQVYDWIGSLSTKPEHYSIMDYKE